MQSQVSPHSSTLNISAHPLNPILTDIESNTHKIITAMAKNSWANLHVFPELCLWGYPPNDHLFKEELWQQSAKSLTLLTQTIAELKTSVILGTVLRGHLNNYTFYANVALSWYLTEHGKLTLLISPKSLLPNYDVFQDQRYFLSNTQIKSLQGSIRWDVPTEWNNLSVRWGSQFTLNGQAIVVSICEDIWQDADWPENKHNLEATNVNTYLSQHLQVHEWQSDLLKVKEVTPPTNPPFLINISASPFEKQKINRRISLANFLSQKYQCHFIYLNQLGANNDVIFDGSVLYSFQGQLQAWQKPFITRGLNLALTANGLNDINSAPLNTINEEQELILKALLMGIRDYFYKSQVFDGILISLSGGVDSALVTTLACMALSPQKIKVILQPSPFSSAGSVSDSHQLCHNLGITQIITVPLEPLLKSYSQNVPFLNQEQGLAYENLQARIRGNLVMSMSNAENLMVLATSNKSEIAVGYSTLYGDSCGALLPIGDLYKTEVYNLCRYINNTYAYPIPEEILTKLPSAELRPGQFDQQDLPPYEKLDLLIRLWHEQNQSVEVICQETGLKNSEVRRIIKKINAAEFKRKQSAPILKLSGKTFGVGYQAPPISRINLT